MIVPKEMFLQSGKGFEVIKSKEIERPILIVSEELYEQIEKELE